MAAGCVSRGDKYGSALTVDRCIRPSRSLGEQTTEERPLGALLPWAKHPPFPPAVDIRAPSSLALGSRAHHGGLPGFSGLQFQTKNYAVGFPSFEGSDLD